VSRHSRTGMSVLAQTAARRRFLTVSREREGVGTEKKGEIESLEIAFQRISVKGLQISHEANPFLKAAVRSYAYFGERRKTKKALKEGARFQNDKVARMKQFSIFTTTNDQRWETTNAVLRYCAPRP